MERPTGFDIVQRPKHYNAHPSGVECIEVVERMTFNLGNCCKYLWRGGLKVSDATQDYEKALWYAIRSYENDQAWLFGGQAAMEFNRFMLEDGRASRILARPSPWCEPIRKAVSYTFDLHGGRVVGERIQIYDRLQACIRTAIADERCLGRGMEP